MQRTLLGLPFLLLALVGGCPPQLDVTTEGGDTLYPVYLQIGDDNVGSVYGTITWLHEDGTSTVEPWSVMTINDRHAVGVFPAGRYQLKICTRVLFEEDCVVQDPFTLPFDGTGNGGQSPDETENPTRGTGNSGNSAGDGGIIFNVTGNGNVINTGGGNADSHGNNAGDNSVGSDGDNGGGGNTTPPPASQPTTQPAPEPCGVSVPQQGTALIVGLEFVGEQPELRMQLRCSIARVIGMVNTDIAAQLLPCEELTRVEYVVSQYDSQTGLPVPKETGVLQNDSGAALTTSELQFEVPFIPGLLEFTARAHIRDRNTGTTRVVPWGPVTNPM